MLTKNVGIHPLASFWRKIVTLVELGSFSSGRIRVADKIVSALRIENGVSDYIENVLLWMDIQINKFVILIMCVLKITG